MVSWTCKVTWPAILAVLSTSKILWTPSLLLPWAPVYPVTARGCRAPLFAWKTRMDNLIKISVKCASFRSQREMDNFYLFYVYIFFIFQPSTTDTPPSLFPLSSSVFAQLSLVTLPVILVALSTSRILSMLSPLLPLAPLCPVIMKFIIFTPTKRFYDIF